MKRLLFLSLFFLYSNTLFADDNDIRLRQLIADHGLQSLSSFQSQNDAQVELGRSLFFDRELSGNRDVSCASCHHSASSSGDARALPAGVGGHGLGPDRTQDPDREVVPRNAPEVFHRGNADWTSMFWDSRIEPEGEGFRSPAGPQLPPGFEGPLAIQAMFPVTSRAEMRGNDGDLDVNGHVNEIAQVADGDFQGIWNALTNRLLAIPAYREAFQRAYPNVPENEIGFEHAAQAIAEFEAAAFSPTDSAWDRYLAGDDNALSDAAKRGATHFYSGNCASCHSGDLMTNQEHHNLGVPQLGPGKDASHLDIGRALETKAESDEFKFRTPPLRNVTLTGPWLHNGAYSALEDVIRHKYDPEQSLAEYDINQLPEHLRSTVKLSQETLDRLTASLDPMLPLGETLTDDELHDMMAFLAALTTPSADLFVDITPDEVLSGLEVETLPPSELALLYDPASGSLMLSGAEDISVDALFLRISADELGEADFEFATGKAPWSADREVVLSDEMDAQSFLDYRRAPEHLFSAGDELASLLPAGLGEGDILDHVSAVYRLHGSPMLWAADVATVPEPSGLAWAAIGLLAVFRARRL